MKAILVIMNLMEKEFYIIKVVKKNMKVILKKMNLMEKVFFIFKMEIYIKEILKMVIKMEMEF